MVSLNRLALAVWLALLSGAAWSQVYRCEVEGKTRYSDEPCLGATRVDVRPTRGLDKMSGQSRKGRDVRAEEFNKMAADVYRPIYRETPDERAVRVRRIRNNLTPDEHVECGLLDQSMTSNEAAEKAASGEERKRVQQRLLQQRQSYRKLKC